MLDAAQSAVAPGGTLLLIGHDRRNLEEGHGGPPDPAVLYSADDIVSMVPDLHIDTAGTRLRPVETAGGPVEAIDCLVRARRTR